MDFIRLESLKNKDEHAQSAIASQEVREHLAGFIRSKRGSSTQISSIANQSGKQHTSTDSNHEKAGLPSANCVGQSSSNQDNDDHPLRKTASMPTMHIPYKAQSLSRRRQMERRTTMSPLMKRKSRPRRPLLHSLDSTATEYSSNPCILHSSGANVRSLSQSSSPPPPIASCNTRELLQTTGCSSRVIRSYLCHGDMMKSSSQTNLDEQPGNLLLKPADVNDDTQEALRQQHLRVQEAIRKTIIRRTSGRSKMVATGGSLDSDMSAPKFTSKAASTNSSGESGVGSPGGHLFTSLNHSANARNREELRQWSLDGADLKASLNANKTAAAAAANRTLAWGLFHREFHRLKLATTNDAATLRRSQSPSSSISMGVPSSQTTASIQQQQQKSTSSTSSASGSNHHHQQLRQPSAKLESLSRLGQQQPPRTKHYSSSSSSTSSLLSAQDSLEDSSPQAIDLSSSGEASRHRTQHPNHATAGLYHRAHLTSSGQRPNSMDHSSNHLNRLNYQKVLQDSFNQLQLCQTHDGMKQMLLPTTHSIEGGHLEQRQHPLLGQTNKVTTSLDIPTQQQQRNFNELQHSEFLTSLSRQFNLSASAQNLISLQEQQQVQINSFIAQQQQQQDLNTWLMAYNNLIQSAEFQQSNQITSSLLTKITSLPEPYKSALLNQMVQQQQLRLLDMAQEAGKSSADFLFIGQPSSNHDGDQKSMIGRALSSPILIANTKKGANNIETPMQSVEFERDHQGLISATFEHDISDTFFNRASHQQRHDVRMKDCSDDYAASAESQHQHGTANNFTSLDLSLSSSNKMKTDLGERGSHSPQPRADAKKLDRQLDYQMASQSNNLSFSSMLQQQASSIKINCNFLYNPIFDQNSSTGLIYELEFCNHKCICSNESNHPENSLRVLAIWRRLHDSGLMSKCARIESRRATIEELQLSHGETYVNYFGRSPYERIKLRQLDLSKLPIEGLTQLECGGQGADIDTAWNEEQTPGVARLAVGCVIEAAVQVANGKLLNAFAAVRPPGHHAEYQQAMGFCFFNSIAVATRVLLTRHQVSRVLIVDWDVHHGNGLQKMFYEDKNVMYISLHRHDKGNFFPGTGDIREVGLGQGEGYNWNIAWSGETMGDAEYLAAFRSVVMPIARDFNPSMVLVACGFDGARGHPFNFGGYELSPACFAHMTSQLMSLANGRLVLCLEGGYQLKAICDCAESCVRTLLRDNHRLVNDGQTAVDRVRESELKREPNQNAREVLHELSQLAARYWPNVARWKDTIDVSAVEAAYKLM